MRGDFGGLFPALKRLAVIVHPSGVLKWPAAGGFMEGAGCFLFVVPAWVGSSREEFFLFMKNHISVIFVVLVVSTFGGCSRHSPDAQATAVAADAPAPKVTADAPAPKVTDLGIVDVSKGKPIRQDLGDGKACVITPTVITKGGTKIIRMAAVFEQTDSSGVVHKQAAPISICNPGDTPEWRVGDIVVRLKTALNP